MYCEKCNKQSPENFKHCAYCGATFHKKKKERKEAHARVALACMDETKEKFVPWKTETSM